MAGIDNNTVLYLRGDSFKDLSPSKIDIVNNGVTIINDGNFGKCFNFKNSNTFMYFVSDLFNFGTNDFTIEFFVKLNDTHSYHPLFMSGVSGTQGELVKCSIYENRIDYGGSLGTSGTKPLSSMANYSGKWIHVAMIRKSNNLKFYIDGVSTGEGKTQVYDLNNTRYSIGKDLWYPNNYFNGEMYNIRISNVARHTEDFVPPTQPYTKSDINIIKQTDSQISFNITDNIGIKKVEVLVNNIVSKTYTDNYNNLTYNIDISLCAIGNNKITIRVTYDDTYTEEISLNHNVTVDELPLETPLLDTVERVKLLTKSKQAEKTMLSSILTSKNVEVTEEDKMSDLIGKVDLLGGYDDKLWLYKDGDEYTDVTGGFVSHQAQSKPPTLTKTSSYMEYKAQSGSYTSGNYGTNLPINVTDYSLLKFEVETLNMGSTHYGCNFGLTTNKDMDSSVAAIQITTNKSKHIISLDISSISGLNYVYSDTTYNNTSRIYKIWLEK